MGDAKPDRPVLDRIVTLDLIRGIAVLGILAVNIAGFAGPTGATLSPHVPTPGSMADEAVFFVNLLLFDGKMRALFTMLFGASMVLFIERAEAAGREGDLLQLRRLGWLLVFGSLHFFLLWWGDILFSYALVGLVALFMRDLQVKTLLASALIIFAGWHLGSGALLHPEVRAEERVRTGTGTLAEARAQRLFERQIDANAQSELAEHRMGFADQVAEKVAKRPFWLLEMTLPNIGETLPLMLMGMAAYRTGFFSGGWPRRRLWQLGVVGTLTGLAITAVVAAWLWQRHFPPHATTAALIAWLAIPRLLMASGYAALVALAAPCIAQSWLGKRFIAAGRMAFTNYIGTTILMTAIFYGWGLGLVGSVDRIVQPAFVIAAWALMLAWSPVWLARFRQGPLEWLWRSLTEWRIISLRNE